MYYLDEDIEITVPLTGSTPGYDGMFNYFVVIYEDFGIGLTKEVARYSGRLFLEAGQSSVVIPITEICRTFVKPDDSITKFQEITRCNYNSGVTSSVDIGRYNRHFSATAQVIVNNVVMTAVPNIQILAAYRYPHLLESMECPVADLAYTGTSRAIQNLMQGVKNVYGNNIPTLVPKVPAHTDNFGFGVVGNLAYNAINSVRLRMTDDYRMSQYKELSNNNNQVLYGSKSFMYYNTINGIVGNNDCSDLYIGYGNQVGGQSKLCDFVYKTGLTVHYRTDPYDTLRPVLTPGEIYTGERDGLHTLYLDSEIGGNPEYCAIEFIDDNGEIAQSITVQNLDESERQYAYTVHLDRSYRMMRFRIVDSYFVQSSQYFIHFDYNRWPISNSGDLNIYFTATYEHKSSKGDEWNRWTIEMLDFLAVTKEEVINRCNSRYFLEWYDRMGGIQCQPFCKNDTFSEDISRDDTANYKGEKRPLDVQVQPKWELNTNWLSKDLYPYYESLLVSPYVVLYDWDEDKSYVVNVTDKSYKEKTYKNNNKSLFNLTVNVELNKKQTMIY